MRWGGEGRRVCGGQEQGHHAVNVSGRSHCASIFVVVAHRISPRGMAKTGVVKKPAMAETGVMKKPAMAYTGVTKKHAMEVKPGDHGSFDDGHVCSNCLRALFLDGEHLQWRRCNVGRGCRNVVCFDCMRDEPQLRDGRKVTCGHCH